MPDIHLPDGSIARFPDTMSDAEIERALKKRFRRHDAKAEVDEAEDVVPGWENWAAQAAALAKALPAPSRATAAPAVPDPVVAPTAPMQHAPAPQPQNNRSPRASRGPEIEWAPEVIRPDERPFPAHRQPRVILKRPK